MYKKVQAVLTFIFEALQSNTGMDVDFYFLFSITVSLDYDNKTKQILLDCHGEFDVPA